MIKVGLTGIIGSGKSLAASIFVRLGVPVYCADQHAREMLDLTEVKMKLREMFGPAIFDASGQVQRKLLAQRVFNNQGELEALNNLIHPRVKAHFDAWLKAYNACTYVIHEAAILFESGFYHDFDKIIVVDAPQEVCMSRVMQRDGVTREQVNERMQHQWKREEKISKADYIILNDGHRMIIPQVLAVHAQLKELASKG